MPRPLRAIAEFFKRDYKRRSTREKDKWEKRKNRCTRCWYDMRGGIGEVCPECGTPKSRGESIWTDGRWHWRAGWYCALVVVVLYFVAMSIAELIMHNATAATLDQLNRGLLVPPSAIPLLKWRPTVFAIVASANIGTILCVLPLAFFTMNRSTRQQHLLVRFLVPLVLALIATRLGRELIVTFE